MLTPNCPVEGRTLHVRLQRWTHDEKAIMGDVISARSETMPGTFKSSTIPISACLACSCSTKLTGFNVKSIVTKVSAEVHTPGAG